MSDGPQQAQPQPARDPEALVRALRAALEHTRAAKAARSSPSRTTSRRAMFWQAGIAIFLALVAVPVGFALARLTASSNRTARVVAVQYEPARNEIIVWLANEPMSGLPAHVHRHYKLVVRASMQVMSYRVSADGNEVFVVLRASPSHRLDQVVVYKTRPR